MHGPSLHGTMHGRHRTLASRHADALCPCMSAGVLSLPSACALLGWVLGPTFLVLFGFVALWTAFMLTDIYEVDGKKHRSYKGAVLAFLGPQHQTVLSVILYVQMWLIAGEAACGNNQGGGRNACFPKELIGPQAQGMLPPGTPCGA